MANIAAGKRPADRFDCVDGKLPEGKGPKEMIVDNHMLIEIVQRKPCFCSSEVTLKSFIEPSGEAAFHGGGASIFRGQCKENGHHVEFDLAAKVLVWQLYYSEGGDAVEAVHTKDQRTILALGLDGFVHEFDVPGGLFEEDSPEFARLERQLKATGVTAGKEMLCNPFHSTAALMEAAGIPYPPVRGAPRGVLPAGRCHALLPSFYMLTYAQY